MKRLLKNSVYFAVIVVIIVLASRMYYTGGQADQECSENIKNASFRGTNPQEKIAYLADCINIVHGESISVTGWYNTQNNTVEYSVDLDFVRPSSQAEFSVLKESEKRGIGDLAVTTAKLLVPDMTGTNYEGAGISGMVINVSIIQVARRNLDEKGEQFYESAPFLQKERIKEAHFFERSSLEKLAKEDNVLNWDIYQSPSVWDEYYPGIGQGRK